MTVAICSSTNIFAIIFSRLYFSFLFIDATINVSLLQLYHMHLIGMSLFWHPITDLLTRCKGVTDVL